jgi:hypothetical protein
MTNELVERAGKSMSADTAGKRIVFRHGTFATYPRLTTSISLGLLLAVLLVAVFNGLHWILLTLLCVFAVWLYASLAYVKFEIWERGFSHRNLSGNHVFEFAGIEDALFETANVGEGYPAPVFSVRLRGEIDRKKVPIGMFPVRAAALLFAALERFGIRVREDGSPFVQSTMRQIREVQGPARLSLTRR